MLVGGEAVRFYGARTDDDAKNDTDILYRHDLENCKRISKAVSEIHPQFANGSHILNVNELARPKRQCKVDGISVDLLGCSEFSEYDDFEKRAVTIMVSSVLVKIISLPDLILMKEIAVRDIGNDLRKHSRDLDALRVLRK